MSGGENFKLNYCFMPKSVYCIFPINFIKFTHKKSILSALLQRERKSKTLDIMKIKEMRVLTWTFSWRFLVYIFPNGLNALYNWTHNAF